MVLVRSPNRIMDSYPAPRPFRRNRVNLFDLAYQRIEDMLVNCALRPGQFLTMQDLQTLTALGRTPVHHAVNRFAADTLIRIRPRHGLQIAPIDLVRERMLLNLRRDIERFVIRLATERAKSAERDQLLQMERVLSEKRKSLNLSEFNALDRDIDLLILAAANEPFLEHTLRPLHTLFRRVGYIFHTSQPRHASLDGTIDHHIAVLNAIASGQSAKAVKASDALMDFVDGMVDALETAIEPASPDGGGEATTGYYAMPGPRINPAVRAGLQQQATL
jgi:DNA-binding GntR family transcriptional regulator